MKSNSLAVVEQLAIVSSSKDGPPDSMPKLMVLNSHSGLGVRIRYSLADGSEPSISGGRLRWIHLCSGLRAENGLVFLGKVVRSLSRLCEPKMSRK